MLPRRGACSTRPTRQRRGRRRAGPDRLPVWRRWSRTRRAATSRRSRLRSPRWRRGWTATSKLGWEEALVAAHALGRTRCRQRTSSRGSSASRPASCRRPCGRTAIRFRALLGDDPDQRFLSAAAASASTASFFQAATVQPEHAEWLVAEGRAEEAEPLLAEARQTSSGSARPWLERSGDAHGSGGRASRQRLAQRDPGQRLANDPLGDERGHVRRADRRSGAPRPRPRRRARAATAASRQAQRSRPRSSRRAPASPCRARTPGRARRRRRSGRPGPGRSARAPARARPRSRAPRRRA